MKSRKPLFLGIMTLTALVFPLQLAAKDGQLKHHHYKLIDAGTFGGPQSYVNGFLYSEGLGVTVQNLNNPGMLAGWADTSTLDPYQNFCFNYGEFPCYAAHAFQWRDGVKNDLGALPQGASSATAWISANGLIAGASQNGETDPLDGGYPQDRAVLWHDGKIIDLGTLPEGGYESGAQAVNSGGQVVGWAYDTVPDSYSMASFSSLYNWYAPAYLVQERAFLWQNGVMQDLGTLGTGTDAYAMAINEQGQVTGISYTNSTPNQILTPCSISEEMIPTQDPFLWEKGKMTDLGTLGGTCGFPSWINNYGEVVGFSDLEGDQTWHPFLWTRWTGMQDLGTLGGNFGIASMISDLGVVVGGSTLAGDSQLDAFLWDGKMHDLGALDGCSYAFAVNIHGQVVGNGCEGAFLWESPGPMVDLSTLLTSKTDLILSAININDRGEITGVGTDASDNSHTILLIPCDQDHPGLEGCDYGLVDATTGAQVSSDQSGAVVANENNDRPIRWRKRLDGRLFNPRSFSGVRSPNN